MAEVCGTDYRTINVVVFCVIGPFVFLVMLFVMYAFHQEAKHYKLCWELAMGRARSAEDNYKRLAASKVISSRLRDGKE